MPLPEKHKVNVFHLTELAKGFFKYWLTVKAYWEPWWHKAIINKISFSFFLLLQTNTCYESV